MAILFLFFAYSVLLQGFQAEPDPCDTAEVLHRHEDRGTRCVISDSNQVCDRYALNETVWYHVPNQSPTDNLFLDMATSPAELNTCGTSFPIWLNGSLPGGNRTQKIMTACMRGLKNVCQTAYNITVVSCPPSYHVYKLRATDTFNAAYCFGNDVCHGSTTTAPVTTQQPGPSTVDLGVSEPCNTTHNLHHAGGRGTRCSGDVKSQICDRYAVEDVWYRVKSGGKDLELVTKPPPINMCGTSFPIWMNGTHPTNGATVNRTACENGIDGSCLHRYNISIKHCDTYHVYKLQSTLVCDAAYCFGQDRTCEISGYDNSGVHLSPFAFLLAICVACAWMVGGRAFLL
ncbi:uncharacterized protein LOC110461195 [Mizuhopecten yessoensis]|uniref:uncharacterized protein LOC110461195 n=1 Tax=Mizuhopecten yessoensis TaxID=6573 RepID=UPI000B45773E|nr:uncharacterized protein LOC110461195 [Mizuhopecten yessoensis]